MKLSSSKISTNTLTFIYLLFYCDHGKRNLIIGLLIFLFVGTGAGIIFVCSAGYTPNVLAETNII